jgi:hypothetical protein
MGSIVQGIRTKRKVSGKPPTSIFEYTAMFQRKKITSLFISLRFLADRMIPLFKVPFEAVDPAWVLSASSARAFLKSPGAMSLTNKISASLMAGAAFWIALKE